MKNISLQKYGPIISTDKEGSVIYEMINNELKNDSVQLDMSGIVSMTTYCAKQIFGKLYNDLGPEQFFERIQIKNASDSVKLTIRLGITMYDSDK